MVDSTSLMMNGMQQFADANGVPYLAGKVYMYIPNSTTFKDNWQDIDHNALNSTPIVLDAAGRCVIWGTGEYRQLLLDRNGDTIWDKITVSVTSQEDVENIVNNAISEVISFTDLPVFVAGKPDASEIFPVYLPVRALTLPASLTGSRFRVDTATLPTGDSVFTLYKNAVAIGTISFAASGVPTVTFASAVSFDPTTDRFSMIAPTVQDATMENISFTFKFSVDT